jgi:hypothetical protein
MALPWNELVQLLHLDWQTGGPVGVQAGSAHLNGPATASIRAAIDDACRSGAAACESDKPGGRRLLAQAAQPQPIRFHAEYQLAAAEPSLAAAVQVRPRLCRY